jgi:hypothetical protein
MSVAVAQSLIDRVKQQLEPGGWSVTSSSGHLPRFSVTVAHLLSSRMTISLDASQDSVSDSLARFLARREFEVIKRAPRSTPHAELISALRQNAAGLDWPPTVIERLAQILRVQNVLTHDEADWLADAGAAWAEEE